MNFWVINCPVNELEQDVILEFPLSYWLFYWRFISAVGMTHLQDFTGFAGFSWVVL
jgi:hypothetical protein